MRRDSSWCSGRRRTRATRPPPPRADATVAIYVDTDTDPVQQAPGREQPRGVGRRVHLGPRGHARRHHARHLPGLRGDDRRGRLQLRQVRQRAAAGDAHVRSADDAHAVAGVLRADQHGGRHRTATASATRPSSTPARVRRSPTGRNSPKGPPASSRSASRSPTRRTARRSPASRCCSGSASISARPRRRRRSSRTSPIAAYGRHTVNVNALPSATYNGQGRAGIGDRRVVARRRRRRADHELRRRVGWSHRQGAAWRRPGSGSSPKARPTASSRRSSC